MKRVRLSAEALRALRLSIGLPADPSDDVGYARPPRHSRFQKGKSGNPKGRPKGAISYQRGIIETLKLPVTTTVAGKRKSKPVGLMIHGVQAKKALEGDTRAYNALSNNVHRFGVNEKMAAEETIREGRLSETEERILNELLESISKRANNE